MILRYVVRRLLQLIPVLVLVSLAVFLLVRAIPGDPVLVMLGIDPDARSRISEEQYRALQHQIGLDQPIYIQYLNWADKIIHGDFGLSLASRRPIFEIIFERYPATLYLAVTALLVGIVIAVPAGVIAAIRQNTRLDYAAMAFALGGVAMPDFWLALQLMRIFIMTTGLLPSIGYASPLENPLLFLQHAM